MSTIFDDEFAGQGGSYVVDPKTGKRKLVERTQEPEAKPAQPDQPVSAPAEAQE